MKIRIVATVIAFAGIAAVPAHAQGFGDRDGLAGFERADTNGDGVVTRAEFAASRMARFDKMDRDGDGAISKSDFKRLSRFRPQAMERIDALIAQGDSNKDGRLTRAEMNAAPMPAFDRVDANGDGAVDKDELARAREAMQAIRERNN